jgi:hypothetical protein
VFRSDTDNDIADVHIAARSPQIRYGGF